MNLVSKISHMSKTELNRKIIAYMQSHHLLYVKNNLTTLSKITGLGYFDLITFRFNRYGPYGFPTLFLDDLMQLDAYNLTDYI